MQILCFFTVLKLCDRVDCTRGENYAPPGLSSVGLINLSLGWLLFRTSFEKPLKCENERLVLLVTKQHMCVIPMPNLIAVLVASFVLYQQIV